MKQLVKITKSQITEKGVQSLADRPNASAQYGVGGLSPQQLKLWFDKLATFLAEKINEVYDTISAADAADYIRLALDDYGVESLGDLVEAMLSGDFANKILQVFPSANSFATVPLQKYINDAAQAISENAEAIEDLQNDKLDKVTSAASYRRAYIIDTDGKQKVIYISDAPLSGAIPVFVGDGQINVAVPAESAHAANKGYVDQRDRFLASTIEISVDKSNYLMTLRLKNTAGSVLSTAQVDLPLESVIVSGEYANGTLTLKLIEGNEVKIDISDVIDGLVNTVTHEAAVSALNKRIDDANLEHDTLVQEIELSKIYAHAAYHAEESETARSYTKGGKIDRHFRIIEKTGGTSLSVTMDSNYKLSIALKNRSGEVLSEGMVDLPIESLITSASYKNKVLTLKFQSGNTLAVNISDLISGLVPDSRKVNGKALSGDITLTAEDVGAYPKSETFSRTETSAAIDKAKTALQTEIDGKQAVGFAYQSVESEKAGGYTKGGEIDRELRAIKKRLSSLEPETT